MNKPSNLIKSTKHEHVYDTYEGQRVRVTNPKYVGSTGDRALIYKVCKCTCKLAIDYLLYKEAQIKLKELRGEPNNDKQIKV